MNRLDVVMNRRLPSVQLVTVTFVVMLTIGCSSSSPEPDADALALWEMAGNALAVSGIDEPMLRQIFANQIRVNPYSGSHGFVVTDKDSKVGFTISAETPDQPPSDWRVTPLQPPTRYQGGGIFVNVESLIVGPTRAMDAIAAHWPRCIPRGQTVAGSTEGNTWYLFCDLPEGTVSGQVNAETGEFTPSGAPPAVPPVTATTEV